MNARRSLCSKSHISLQADPTSRDPYRLYSKFMYTKCYKEKHNKLNEMKDEEYM